MLRFALAAIGLGIAAPLAAQESLLGTETPGEPVPLAPLAGNDARTAAFRAAWEQFAAAMLARDKAGLAAMLGAGSPAVTEARLTQTLGFILAQDAPSPFGVARAFSRISNPDFATRSVVLGWQAPAGLSASERAELLAQPGGQAIGCYCSGPYCHNAKIATTADAANVRPMGFACARMIMASDGAIRFEVAVPGGDALAAPPVNQPR